MAFASRLPQPHNGTERHLNSLIRGVKQRFAVSSAESGLINRMKIAANLAPAVMLLAMGWLSACNLATTLAADSSAQPNARPAASSDPVPAA